MNKEQIAILDRWITASGDEKATRLDAVRGIVEDYGALQSDHEALREALANMRATEEARVAARAQAEKDGFPLRLTREAASLLSAWLAAHPDAAGESDAVARLIDADADRAVAEKEADARRGDLCDGPLNDIVTAMRTIASWRYLIFHRLCDLDSSCDFEAAEGIVEAAKHAEALLWDAYQQIGSHLAGS